MWKLEKIGQRGQNSEVGKHRGQMLEFGMRKEKKLQEYLEFRILSAE
jgi:hypothetical protein